MVFKRPSQHPFYYGFYFAIHSCFPNADIFHYFWIFQCFFLIHHKSIKTLIQNRLKRIVYPFIVFLFLLWPLIIFSFKFTEFSFEGSENALLQTLYIFTNPLFVIPQMSFHLWFLYILLVWG